MNRVAGAIAIAAFFACSAAAAQEASRVLVALEAPGFGAGIAEGYEASLASALSRSPSFGLVMRADGSDSPASEAGRLGYDLALSARVESLDSGIRVTWSISGATAGEELGSGTFDAERPGEKELAEYFWAELVAAAEKAAAAIGPLGSARLVVKGPPGAIVYGLGDGPLAIPPEGEIEIAAKAPATYAWRASAKGYYESSGVAAVFGSRAELTIGLSLQRPWNLEVGLFNGAFPDLWASRRFLDDRLFARVGFFQYLAGFALWNEKPDYDPAFLLSIPLIQPGLGAGWIFGKSGSAIRPYLGATATTRIAFPKGAGVFIDPVAPLCVQPYAGIEWKAIDRFGFFAEMGADFYPFADGFLLAASTDSSNGLVAIKYGGGWGAHFPSLRFGTRFYL